MIGFCDAVAGAPSFSDDGARFVMKRYHAPKAGINLFDAIMIELRTTQPNNR
jgi:hypothetical protein